MRFSIGEQRWQEDAFYLHTLTHTHMCGNGKKYVKTFNYVWYKYFIYIRYIFGIFMEEAYNAINKKKSAQIFSCVLLGK